MGVIIMKKIVLILVLVASTMNIMANEKMTKLFQEEKGLSENLLTDNDTKYSKFIRKIKVYFCPTIGQEKHAGREASLVINNGRKAISFNDGWVYWVDENPEYKNGNDWWCSYTHRARKGYNGYWYFNL